MREGVNGRAPVWQLVDIGGRATSEPLQVRAAPPLPPPAPERLPAREAAADRLRHLREHFPAGPAGGDKRARVASQLRQQFQSRFGEDGITGIGSSAGSAAAAPGGAEQAAEGAGASPRGPLGSPLKAEAAEGAAGASSPAVAQQTAAAPGSSEGPLGGMEPPGPPHGLSRDDLLRTAR